MHPFNRNNFVKLAIIGGDDHKIPSYKFINQNGDTIDNSHYNNHIYIADFFFTKCPTICPVMTYNMKYIQKELSIYPNIKFLSHTVDPENDTPKVPRKAGTLATVYQRCIFCLEFCNQGHVFCFKFLQHYL